MKKKTIIVFIAVFVFLVQAACAVDISGLTGTQEPQPATQDVSGLVSTSVALTQAAQQVNNPPTNQPPDVVATTEIPAVIPSITASIPTNTTAPAVQGTVNYSANCRLGPGANFRNVAILDQNTQVAVVGKNEIAGVPWWLVRSAGLADCWLIDEAVTISGDKASVAFVVSPPTPTPVPPPTWGGTWTFWQSGGFSGDEGYSGPLVIIQSGNVVTWNYKLGSTAFSGIGTVSLDGMTVSAKETSSDGSFTWDTILRRNPANLNQFRGSWGVGNSSWDGAFCGAIKNAGKPSPCKG
jgi:hypothetical protein